jgi:hypothetical protein
MSATDEATWLSCADPDRLLAHLVGRASDRKLRLFFCGCCRLAPGLLADRQAAAAVEAVERAADRLAGAAPLGDPGVVARATAGLAVRRAADEAAYVDLRRQQADLLRELFGNPFRPARAARAIDDERRFEELPVLADALEEAGCAAAGQIVS